MTRKWLWLVALVGLMGGNILCANGEEWPQVFADDCARVDLFGPDWVVKSGRWDIRGELKATGPNAFLMCTRRFQVPFRIEYECSSANPGDLSVQFTDKPGNSSMCFVCFGSELNKKNKICVPGGGDIAVSKENMIEPGRRHRVSVEVTATNVHQMIDGKESVKADVIFPKKGVYFGFYVWTVGSISGVKVYSPNVMETGKVEAVKEAGTPEQAAVREFKSFEDWPAGSIAGTNSIITCGEKCSVKIADVPTWLYYNVKSKYRNYQENEDPAKVDAMMKGATNKGCRFVSDHCVELVSEDASGKGKAEITLPMPAMRNGLAEFDVMADQYAGDALRVRLGDKLGLFIDREGTFYWESGDQKIKLADKINYTAIGGGRPARFYLWPQRWFTLRIDFDTSTSLASVTVLNLYNSCHRFENLKNDVSRVFIIGEDLPLPADAVSNITFETAGAGRFYIDNLFFINRTSDLADDLKWRVQALDIMPAYYHLRKDPPTLKIWSLRNIRNAFGNMASGDEFEYLVNTPEKYPVILESARQYNEILIKQIFLAEQLRGLERAYFYLNIKSEEQAGKHNERITQARKSVAETEELLAQLFRFYAGCYLDRLNQGKLMEGFSSRHAALKTAIARSEELIQASLRAMRPASSDPAAAVACPYEQRPEAGPLTFSKGSHRRNGAREFLFVKTGLVWPYMEKALLFSDLYPAGLDFAAKAKEPAYCDNSTNTWFYTCLTRSTNNSLLALKVMSGLHYHESTLPTWWVEKHKANRDIFLQNCKGDSSVGQSGSASVNKSYNYWNPEVMTAQKGYLEGIVDVLAGYNKDLLKRVAYIDMAQEALFQIEASGGLWETGYNKTAVNAFQEYLKKVYGKVADLNAKWGSQYADFAAIQPPDDFCLKPRMVPSGLAYEFERFRMQSWSDWLKQSQQWIKAKLPDKNTPSSCDISYPILSCQDSIEGFNSVSLFETFDIVMEHNQLRFANDHGVYRYIENLRQAFRSSTGIGEWYPGGPGELFDEQAVLNDSLRQTFQQVQWGRNVLVYWGGHCNNFLENGNWTDNRLGHTVFRYHAGYIPLGIARARAHQAIYLECPLVEPDVGVVESETSFYNVTGVRGGLGAFSETFFNKGHDFGFLFERLIMDGRQKLDGYKVLILPNAFSLPADFTQKLMTWVEKGGLLIATGPVGVWNEYGQTNGQVLNKVIGEGNWTSAGRIFKLKDKLADTEILKVVYRKEMSFLLEGRHGKGRVFICQGSVPNDMVYELISKNAPRVFYGEGNKFHLVMREDTKGVAGKAGTLYLSILNPDCYQTLEDEITVKDEYKNVADISCNFPIATTIKDGYTRFKVKLAPAEGIMIRIGK